MGWVAEQRKGKSGGDGPSRAECRFQLTSATLTMRQLRQMPRFAGDSISGREIGRMLGVARSPIQDSLKHAQETGLALPVSAERTDPTIEKGLPRPAVSGG